MPTILELTGAKAPDVYKGIVQKPIHGQSLAYTFDHPDQPTVKRIQHFEIASNRGIWKNGWKAVAQHRANTSFDEDEWELYDTKNDFSEYYNLANKYPEKFKDLIDDWRVEAEKYDSKRRIQKRKILLNEYFIVLLPCFIIQLHPILEICLLKWMQKFTDSPQIAMVSLLLMEIKQVDTRYLLKTTNYTSTIMCLDKSII